MRKILMSLVILALVYNGADAGIFKEEVVLLIFPAFPGSSGNPQTHRV